MKVFKAFVARRRGFQQISLEIGGVYRISKPKKGWVRAHVRTPYGKEYFFWISKPNNKSGARRQVQAHHGREYPTITYRGALFPVEVNTQVMFERPDTAASVPIVISTNHYEGAMRKIRSGEVRDDGIEVIGPRRHQHRFVAD